MKIFKMLGQLLEQNSDNIVIKSKTLVDMVQEYNEKFLRSQEELKKSLISTDQAGSLRQPVRQNSNQNSNHSHNKHQNTPQNSANTFYVLFAPNGDTLAILRNKNKEEIKLYGISHADKNNLKAKQACKYLNDLVLKKKVFFEEVNVKNNIEYKIFLDKEKTASLNDLLIQNNLSFSGKTKEDYLIEQKNDFDIPSNSKEIPEKTKKENRGVFVKSLTAPYLFKEENKSSYVVVLDINGKEEAYWGVDLQRVVQQNDIKKGDSISLENIGPELVSVDVPIKQNGNIIRYEKKQVKRNTWKADILERAKIVEFIPSSSQVQPEVSKTPAFSNCYALFSITASSFVCMHNNKKEEYQLRGIDEELLNTAKSKEIKKYLNELISKKVVYIKKTNEKNDIIDLYLHKDDKVSVNDKIINHFKLNDPILEKVEVVEKETKQPIVHKPIVVTNQNTVLAESPIFDEIAPTDNLSDYGYQDNNFSDLPDSVDFEPPANFFEGFDIPEGDIFNPVATSDNKIDTVSLAPDNFFDGFDLPSEDIYELPIENNTIIKTVKSDSNDFFADFSLEDSDIQSQNNSTGINILNNTIELNNDKNNLEVDFLDFSIEEQRSEYVEQQEVIAPIKKKLAFGKKK